MKTERFPMLGIKEIKVNTPSAQVNFLPKCGTDDITIEYNGDFYESDCFVENNILFVHAKCDLYSSERYNTKHNHINICLPEEYSGCFNVKAYKVVSEIKKIKAFRFDTIDNIEGFTLTFNAKKE